MIIFIAAIDSKRGIANELGIPWLGKIPGDIKHFRQTTLNSTVVMGYKTYTEFSEPLSKRRNIVASHSDEQLRPGFEPIKDIRQFLTDIKAGPDSLTQDNIYVIGGAKLFETTIDLADRLDLTLIDQDFKCTKFFPEFEDSYKLTSKSEPYTENDITYRFTIWDRK